MERKNNILERRVEELTNKINDFSVVLEKISDNPPKNIDELRKAMKEVMYKSSQMIEMTKSVTKSQIAILKAQVFTTEVGYDCKRGS